MISLLISYGLFGLGGAVVVWRTLKSDADFFWHISALCAVFLGGVIFGVFNVSA